MSYFSLIFMANVSFHFQINNLKKKKEKKSNHCTVLTRSANNSGRSNFRLVSPVSFQLFVTKTERQTFN